MTEFTIRWRLNDPTETNSRRWSKVHICISSHRHDSGVQALCGVRVPDYPYDSKYDVERDYCKTCLRVEGETKRKKRSNTAEIKGTLTSIFRSRGGSMGNVMRRLMHQMEDGDLSWAAVDGVLMHLEKCAASTTQSVRDWRRRLEARAGKQPRLKKKEAAA